jgi:hypothetical protein
MFKNVLCITPYTRLIGPKGDPTVMTKQDLVCMSIISRAGIRYKGRLSEGGSKARNSLVAEKKLARSGGLAMWKMR